MWYFLARHPERGGRALAFLAQHPFYVFLILSARNFVVDIVPRYGAISMLSNALWACFFGSDAENIGVVLYLA